MICDSFFFCLFVFTLHVKILRVRLLATDLKATETAQTSNPSPRLRGGNSVPHPTRERSGSDGSHGKCVKVLV